MIQQIPKHASGFAVPLSGELITDWGELIFTDNYESIEVSGEIEHRYTNPDLHRRIDNESPIPPESDPENQYLLVAYDENGIPYPQTSKVGILDGMHSFRVIDITVHDEESTTCEIP